jgi:Tfp pilus assembly protein PilN
MILFYFMQWKIKKQRKAINFLKQNIVRHMMGYLNAKSVFFEF